MKVKNDHRSKFSNLSIISLLTGRYELNKLTSLPICGFIAQLVEHRTGIRGGHGFESRWSPNFVGLLLSYCLIWKIYCGDHSPLSSRDCWEHLGKFSEGMLNYRYSTISKEIILLCCASRSWPVSVHQVSTVTAHLPSLPLLCWTHAPSSPCPLTHKDWSTTTKTNAQTAIPQHSQKHQKHDRSSQSW